MAGVLDLKLLKKDQLLLLLLGDKNLSMQQVLGKGRDVCACCCALLWACSCLKAGVFVGSMREHEKLFLKAARLPRCDPPATPLNVLHSGSQVTRSYLGSYCQVCNHSKTHFDDLHDHTRHVSGHETGS